MKRLLLAVLLLGSCHPVQSYKVVPPTQVDVKVIGVTDGDTVTVLWNSRPRRVRLDGIDAPELTQAYGAQAKKYTSSLCLGKTVRLVVPDKDKDRPGQVTGSIMLSRGRWLHQDRWLDQEIVKAGYAWWDRQNAPKNTKLPVHEAAARKAKRGLWAGAKPVAPWDYRRPKRS